MRKGREGGEIEQLALPGQRPEELEGGPGTPSGHLPRQGLASRLDLQDPILVLAPVLTFRGISGTCYLWASVSSPTNQGTLGQSVIYKIKKKKRRRRRQWHSFFKQNHTRKPIHRNGTMEVVGLKEVWRFRMLHPPAGFFSVVRWKGT